MNDKSYAQKLRKAFIEYNTPEMASHFLAIVNLDINHAGDKPDMEMLALQLELIAIMSQPQQRVPLWHQ